MSEVERVGVSVDKKLLSMFDQLIAGHGYSNRYEAIPDLIRNRLSEDQLAKADNPGGGRRSYGLRPPFDEAIAEIA